MGNIYVFRVKMAYHYVLLRVKKLKEEGKKTIKKLIIGYGRSKGLR
jgi:hypothetical protein